MQKLIKLSDTHYIVVDDSKIKDGDWCIYKTGEIIQYLVKLNTDNLKKITHSTQLLEGHDYLWRPLVKPLSLSEVEEAINGYSVEKMAKNAYLKHSVKDDRLSLDEQIQRSGGFNVGYSEGFKAHQELVKDKLFTVEDMLNFSWWLNKNLGQYSSDENAHFELKYFNQWKKLNPPKTEWDIEFNEQGKISLAL